MAHPELANTTIAVASAVTSPVQRPSELKVWWLAIRPATLTASIAPVLVAGALAHAEGRFDLGVATVFLAAFALLQITSNLVNDVADFKTGADASDRLGPPRAAQQGWLSARALTTAALLAIVGALAGIAWLARVVGPEVWLGGLVSILGAVAYTAGPVRLGYLGLGDAMVLFFFGFVALGGHHYVQTGHVSAAALLASVAVGAHATAILVVNNLRDHLSDTRAGKRTLVVRFGAGFGRFEYGATLLLPYLLIAVPPLGATPWRWLPWLSLPWALQLVRSVSRQSGSELNGRLGETARLGLAFAVLLALGAVLGA